MDLWVSSDSEDSTSNNGIVDQNNKSLEHYRSLYQMEAQRRKNLEDTVVQLKADIVTLREQLERYQGITTEISLLDNDIKGLDADKGPQQALEAQFVGEPAADLERPSMTINDLHWHELTHAERERRSKARRVKGKNIRLPLQAAVQNAQQQRLESKAFNSIIIDEKQSDVAQTHNKNEEDLSSVTNSVVTSHEAVQDTKKFRAQWKRNVRHDTNTSLRRLNIKLLSKDSNSPTISQYQPSPLSSVPECHLRSQTSNDNQHLKYSWTDSGWDSEDDLTPEEGNIDSSSNHSKAASSFSSISVTSHQNMEHLPFDVDTILIGWARGKSLVQLLDTIQEVSPSDTIPRFGSLGSDASAAEVRKLYL
jgi:hypothetical protein